ncbi:MAG TPA: alcohol dehydrogenase catalytic domain-containing protein [Acidothermaceae bacterium]|jgi:S-(hydroxymethyl)glutathione dehydrogenase/alcohol dehydrogenase
MSVRAGVVTAAGSAPELTEIVLAAPAVDEVLIRVAATGICHTDISWAAGQFGRSTEEFPIVLGHETSGVVEAVGRRDSPFKPGDRVVVALTHHCGVCRFCERGQPVLCDHRNDRSPRISTTSGEPVWQSYGVGGFAEKAIVRASSLVIVPDDVPLETAAVIGCAVATGVGAVWNVAEVEPGSTVLVFGAGAVGVSVISGAAMAGAARIVAVEPNAERRSAALALGATDAVDSTDESLAALLESDRFDYAFESAGKIATIEAAVRHTRRGGTITLIGAAPRGTMFSLYALDFVENHQRLLGCLAGGIRPHDDFPKLFAMYRRGILKLDAMISATAPLSDIAGAFGRSQSAAGLRTVVVPG